MKVENANILIADDVAVVRELHKNMLHDFGFRKFIEAHDGLEAIELAKAHIFDMAILDIEMPKYSGLEVLSELRRLDKGVFVIIVSAEGTTENVKAALDIGVDGFLVKPYSQRKLEDLVTKFKSKNR